MRGNWNPNEKCAVPLESTIQIRPRTPAGPENLQFKSGPRTPAGPENLQSKPASVVLLLLLLLSSPHEKAGSAGKYLVANIGFDTAETEPCEVSFLLPAQRRAQQVHLACAA